MNRFGDNLICTGANEQLVAAFVANDVDFLLVGGLAVAWHCQTREADDMDLLVNPTPANSRRVHNALQSLNVVGHDASSFARTSVQAPVKQYRYADVLTPASDGPTFEEIADATVPANLFGIAIRLPTIPMLVRLKEHALTANSGNRDKHLADIVLLQDSSA